jgi:hypothetical protein
MKKLILILCTGLALACSKTTQTKPEPPKRDYGQVIYVPRGATGEWLLLDSEGNKLRPESLSPTLKVNNLRVYFSYELIRQEEDGVPLVKIITIAIE